MVVEYKGHLVTDSAAQNLEAQYSFDEQKGSFMFFFNHANKKHCIDATEEIEAHLGRLINHSRKRANLKPLVLEVIQY